MEYLRHFLIRVVAFIEELKNGKKTFKEYDNLSNRGRPLPSVS